MVAVAHDVHVERRQRALGAGVAANERRLVHVPDRLVAVIVRNNLAQLDSHVIGGAVRDGHVHCAGGGGVVSQEMRHAR